LISLFGGYFFEWKWTGLVKDANFPMRTLWDWMQLLIIPAVLAGGGLWFNTQQRAREQQIANDRAQDEALQAYLDQMSDLLLEKNLRDSEEGSEVRTLASARTVTAIQRLDAEHNRSLIRFLNEAGLIFKYHIRLSESRLIESREPIVILSEANLSGAELSGVMLIGAYLGEVNLSEADLSWASLFEAVLGGANLSKANLSEAWLSHAVLPGANLSKADLSGAGLDQAILGGANLSKANLSEANLSEANLSGVSPFEDLGVGANLSGANLSRADLSGAIFTRVDFSDANLRGANLRGAKGVTNEELASQVKFLQGATMPDGQLYEDWLLSQGHRDHG